MPGIAIFAIVIGVALLLYGIFRAAGSDSRPKWLDDGHGVDVVYRVPSKFDRQDRK